MQCIDHCFENQNVRPHNIAALFFLAIDNPSHLDRGLEEVIDQIVVATKDQAAIAAIESIREKATAGLHMMQRNTDGVKGMDLFEHQVAFRQRAYSKRESEHKISDSLACSPRTSHQRSLMSVDYHLKIQGVLMADSGEAGFSLQKAAQVRLDKLGLVKNHCVSLIIKSALNTGTAAGAPAFYR